MARSINTILAIMDAEQANQVGLASLNSTSQTAIHKLLKYIVAVNCFLQETLWDIFKKDIETTIDKAPTGSALWLQDRIFKFQYSATIPQVTQLINYAPTYPLIEANLRIVTRCSVNTTALNTVDIKVAKSEPSVALTSTELNSLKGYVSQGGNGTIIGAGVGIGFAGIYYNINSYTSDKIYLKCNVIFNGQYANVIQVNTELAINNYLKNIPFNSNIKVSALMDAIQLVEGVTDVIINDMALRADSTPFANKTFLVNNNTLLINSYPSFAGYIIGETTVSNTFADKITYTSE